MYKIEIPITEEHCGKVVLTFDNADEFNKFKEEILMSNQRIIKLEAYLETRFGSDSEEFVVMDGELNPFNYDFSNLTITNTD